MTAIAERVKRERKLLGWAVEELAVVSGVGVSTVKRIEKGQTVGQKKVLAVIKALESSTGSPEEMRKRSALIAELRRVLLRANELVNDLDRPEPVSQRPDKVVLDVGKPRSTHP